MNYKEKHLVPKPVGTMVFVVADVIVVEEGTTPALSVLLGIVVFCSLRVAVACELCCGPPKAGIVDGVIAWLPISVTVVVVTSSASVVVVAPATSVVVVAPAASVVVVVNTASVVEGAIFASVMVVGCLSASVVEEVPAEFVASVEVVICPTFAVVEAASLADAAAVVVAGSKAVIALVVLLVTAKVEMEVATDVPIVVVKVWVTSSPEIVNE